MPDMPTLLAFMGTALALRLKYLTGGIYICLGVVTALSDTGKGPREAAA